MKNLFKGKRFHFRLEDRESLVGCAIGVGAAALLAFVFYRNLLAFIFLSPLIFITIKIRDKEAQKKQKLLLSLQFRDYILSLSAAMSAGYSIENALKQALHEMYLLHGKEGRISIEIETIVRQVDLSVPVEKVFLDFAERTKNEDIQTFASVLQTAKRGGGDFIRIIRSTAYTISRKLETQKDLQVLLAAKKFEQLMMGIIPLFIILYVNVSSSDLLRPMYETAFGRLVMTLCLGTYILAWIMSKKIADLEV